MKRNHMSFVKRYSGSSTYGEKTLIYLCMDLLHNKRHDGDIQKDPDDFFRDRLGGGTFAC